jgi:hypothetical protein
MEVGVEVEVEIATLLLGVDVDWVRDDGKEKTQ